MAKTSPPDRLRKWRGALSYRKAAAVLGITAPFLLRLERGETLPGVPLADRIEAAGGGQARGWFALRIERLRKRAS